MIHLCNHQRLRVIVLLTCDIATIRTNQKNKSRRRDFGRDGKLD